MVRLRHRQQWTGIHRQPVTDRPAGGDGLVVVEGPDVKEGDLAVRGVLVALPLLLKNDVDDGVLLVAAAYEGEGGGFHLH